jgi:hypothetical protein
MKLIVASGLALTFAGLAFSQQSGLPTASESLLDVLASHKVIAYSFTQSGNLTIRILSESQIRAVKLYDANQESNAAQYDVLMEKKRKLADELRSQIRPTQDREQNADILDNPALAELNREIEKVENPLKGVLACEVTHRGADFIGLKSLATGKGILLPVHAISTVVVESPKEDPDAPPAK